LNPASNGVQPPRSKNNSRTEQILVAPPALPRLDSTSLIELSRIEQANHLFFERGGTLGYLILGLINFVALSNLFSAVKVPRTAFIIHCDNRITTHYLVVLIPMPCEIIFQCYASQINKKYSSLRKSAALFY